MCGQIYSTDIRKSFIINVFESKEKGGVKDLSTNDGLVIAAYASNREEAVNITDELMNN